MLETYQQHFPDQQNSEPLYQWIADWIAEVVQTPLNQDFQLQQLSTGQYLSECPFYLALSDRVLAMQRVQSYLRNMESKCLSYLRQSLRVISMAHRLSLF